MRSGLWILVSGVVLLGAALPTRAPAQAAASAGEASAGDPRGVLVTWLNRREPEQPFRYYGFAEAVAKYFRTRILGRTPDAGDVTRIVRTTDRSAERATVTNEIARLEGRLASVPYELEESARHVEEMKRERERIRAQLLEAQRAFDDAQAQVGGSDVVQNSRAWDARNRLRSSRASLQQRLGEIEAAIARSQTAHARGTETSELEARIAANRGRLAAIHDATRSVDYYLVSYKPLLITTLGSIAALFGLCAFAKRPRRGAASKAFALTQSAVFAGLLYVMLRILAAEDLVPGVSVFASPAAFGVGFALLMATRTACAGRGATAPLRSLGPALTAVAVCHAVIVAQVWSAAVPTGADRELLRSALLGIAGFGVWALAALWILDWNRSDVARILAATAVTSACLVAGTLPAGMAIPEAARAFGAALAASASLLAVEAARGMPPPARRAPDSRHAQPVDGPDESLDPLKHLPRW
ncbi:MAG: hypothetical protein JSU66_12125 [Deltaproteobacteria bacterium]|nr:MAG: hypothetical protein JSU66_12125 [Deltaproteobacteria bacterium]